MDRNEYLHSRLKEQKVLLAAHRGTCGGNIIQNTIGAYENALLHGADIIEVDVVKSTDGQFFAFHNGQEKGVFGEEIEMCIRDRLITTDGRAKRASVETVHGVIQTPVFMNVGTVGAIKGAVSTNDLKDIGTQVELSNTYHLHVRTGDKLIKEFGGLHKFMTVSYTHLSKPVNKICIFFRSDINRTGSHKSLRHFLTVYGAGCKNIHWTNRLCHSKIVKRCV